MFRAQHFALAFIQNQKFNIASIKRSGGRVTGFSPEGHQFVTSSVEQIISELTEDENKALSANLKNPSKEELKKYIYLLLAEEIFRLSHYVA